MTWNIKLDTQKIWIQVKNWDYKFFLNTSQEVREMFQFEGNLSPTSPHSGAYVTGEIKISRETSSNCLGVLNLADDSDMLFGVTFFVTAENYASLRSVFSVAFANRGGGIGIELFLERPVSSKQDFWNTEWKKASIPIAQIGVFSGGKFLEDKGR